MAATLKEQILTLLRSTLGLTDREMTNQLFGPGVGQQATNQAARALAIAGQIVRRPRQDRKIGNYLKDGQHLETERSAPPEPEQPGMLSEDDVKRKLQKWLEASGWHVSVIWGRARGIDLDRREMDTAGSPR